jgi:hypothetical protein
VRNRNLLLVAVVLLAAAGFYAWWASHSGLTARMASTPKPAGEEGASTSTFVPKPIQRSRAPIYSGPKFDPAKTYPPGTYTPQGFAVDYRERVVREFSHFMSSRLGHELDEERAKQVAAVQNKFWDQHGPNTDLLRDGKITQQEFSDRSHQVMVSFATDMEKIFTDEEYQKVFDVPKGTDTFYALAHSKDEQPGMQFKPEPSSPQPNLSVVPTPSPTGASETADPAPATNNNKFPKAAK